MVALMMACTCSRGLILGVPLAPFGSDLAMIDSTRSAGVGGFLGARFSCSLP